MVLTNIEELIGAKYAEENFSTSLAYYAERLQPERAVQIVATLKKSKSKGKLVMENLFETFILATPAMGRR